MQLKTGVLVNDDDGLEHEADSIAAKALEMKHNDQSKAKGRADQATTESGR